MYWFWSHFCVLSKTYNNWMQWVVQINVFRYVVNYSIIILCPSWVGPPRHVNNFAILHAIRIPIDSARKHTFNIKFGCLVLRESSKLKNSIHFQWYTFDILEITHLQVFNKNRFSPSEVSRLSRDNSKLQYC